MALDRGLRSSGIEQGQLAGLYAIQFRISLMAENV